MRIMSEYKPLATSVLVDMLADLTEKYTHMLGNNDRSDKFYDYEVKIHFIQEEINARARDSESPGKDTIPAEPTIK